MFCPKCGSDAGEAKFCPECGTAVMLTTEVPITTVPPYTEKTSAQKTKRVKPIWISLAVVGFVVVCLLTGFLLNEHNGWLGIGSWGKKEVTDYPISVTFPDVVRDGTYTGTISKKEPNGVGVFRAINDVGTTFTLEGTWTDGILNGKVKHIFENGTYSYEGEYNNNLENGYGLLKYENDSGYKLSYKGSFKNGKRDGHGILTWEKDGSSYEGDFKDGGVACQQDYAAALDVEWLFDEKSSYDDVWRKTVQAHSDFFPAITQSSINELNKLARTDIKYEQLKKNAKKYQSDFVALSGTITQIREDENVTWLIVMDHSLNVYYLLYLGQTEFIEDDSIKFIATPLINYSYENIGKTTTNCIAMLANRIYK